MVEKTRDLDYLKAYYRNLPPHVKEREQAKCLKAAIGMIEELQHELEELRTQATEASDE